MRVLGLAASAPCTISGGKNSEKRSTRMPTALAAVKWPSSWRMISAAKPRKARTQLMRAGSPSIRARRRRARASRVGLVERLEVRARGCGRQLLERALDHLRDAEERQPAVEERVHGDLVGGVEHARRGAAGDAPPRARAAGTGTPRSSTALERQRAELGQVERRDRHVGALGIVQRVGDRHAHVRVAEVRERGAVVELDRARGRSTAGARRRRSARTACRTGGGPRSPRGPCSSAWPSRS